MRIYNTQVYGLKESMIRSGYPMLAEIPEDTKESYNDFFPSVKRKVTYLDKECNNICFYEDMLKSKHFKRAAKLGNALAGSGHDCFLKGIIVQADIEAPSYWWPQFQRYHFADIISSQSKMHKILDMDLSKMIFSGVCDKAIEIAKDYVQIYKDGKCSFDDVLANLPMGLELTAAITTNYLQLKTIYAQRKNHRLAMWKEVFCPWIESLPYSRELGIVCDC